MCTGIDLMSMASDILQPEGDDTARISWNVRRIITKYQETFSVIEKVTILKHHSVKAYTDNYQNKNEI